ncbi:MAG: hypothetical protein LBH00_03625 [Planctomycetaceae bacterium]|jgi:hypothetical protein|nr:hypothetical protein [Planctomycetaceae bacterium]
MDIPRPSRCCSVSHREFLPGETFFSVLTEDGGQFFRQDIAAEHWRQPSQPVFGWWKTAAKQAAADLPSKQTSNELLFRHFEQLVRQQNEADAEMLYVLTLLLLRRKWLRYEKETDGGGGNKQIEVYSPQTNLSYQIPAAMPNHDRLEFIQQQLEQIS